MSETSVQGGHHDHGDDDKNEGSYRNDLVLADSSSENPLGLERLELDEVTQLMVGAWVDAVELDLDLDEYQSHASEAAARILESVGVFRLPVGKDARDLESETCGEYVPVRVFRLANHNGRSEGDDKVVSTTPFSGEVAKPIDKRVAVIDSGLPAGGTGMRSPAWIRERISEAWPGLETDGVHRWEVLTSPLKQGHGLFVTSLIARLSGAKVTVSKMAILDPELVTTHDVKLVNGTLRPLTIEELRKVVQFADEFQLVWAVWKLIVASESRSITYDALNLSFGSVAKSLAELNCGGKLTLLGIDLWNAAFSKAPIFAAAGNIIPGTEHPHDPDDHELVIPGAFEGVVAVGSSDFPGGRLSDFSDPRSDVVFPGREAIAISEIAGWNATWSGTSFACAVAAADHVRDPNQRRGPLDPRI